MSTETSTPDPRPAAEGIDEVSALAFGDIFRALVRAGASREDAERYAFAAQLELDLPARDARVREETHQDIARQLETLAVDDELISAWVLTCDPPPLTVADWFRALASKLRAPVESAAAVPAASGEETTHPQPATCTCDSPAEPGFPHRAWCATEHEHPGPACAGLCEPTDIEEADRG